MKSFAPAALLFCTLLTAPALATHEFPHGVISVIEVCDPNDPRTCITCDFTISSPCTIMAPGLGCVPNTIEPRAMRPSTTVENCTPRPPSKEELPEPMWGIPFWVEGDEADPFLATADAFWAEHVRYGILP